MIPLPAPSPQAPPVPIATTEVSLWDITPIQEMTVSLSLMAAILIGYAIYRLWTLRPIRKHKGEKSD